MTAEREIKGAASPRPGLFSLQIGDFPLQIQDAAESVTAFIVGCELHRDEYGLRGLQFKPGDVVLDIGGHVGMFAIYLAKLYPFLRIISYEPIPENAAHFAVNLRRNGVSNVELVPLAVSADGRELEILQHPSNTGAATVSDNYQPEQPANFRYYRVPSLTPTAILARHGLDRIRLLKIDCEGLEHEILGRTSLPAHCDAICGELHINRHLSARGFSLEGLQAHCARYLPPERLRFHVCHMSE